MREASQSAILQLQSPPLEFETWDKEKDSSSTEFKTGMVMEIERARISSLDRRKPTSVAFDIAEGIFHSGLLYESQRVHLGQILQRRQAKSQQHEKVLRHHHTQLLQASLQASSICQMFTTANGHRHNQASQVLPMLHGTQVVSKVVQYTTS